MANLGEVYVNDWKFAKHSAQERVQRDRIFVELPVAPYVTGVWICR